MVVRLKTPVLVYEGNIKSINYDRIQKDKIFILSFKVYIIYRVENLG